MSQATDLTLAPNITGTQQRTELNSIIGAFASLHKGSSRPSYAASGLLWIDDSANPILTLKYFDGTDDITMGTVNATTNVFNPANAMQPSGASIYAADSVGTDSYAITNTSIPTPVAGTMVNVKVGTANTSAATLNVNGTGAVAIKKRGNVDVVTGDIVSGQVLTLVHDGTYWQMQSQIAQITPSAVTDVTAFTSTGSVDVTNHGHYCICSGTFTLSIAASSSLVANWYVSIFNYGTGIITLDPNASETIDGATTITLYPGQGLILIRTGSTSFRTVGRNLFATVPRSAKSSNYTALVADNGTLFSCTSSFTLSLTAAATLGSGWHSDVRNNGTGIITLDPNSSETVDGATTVPLYPGESCRLICDGSNFNTMGRQTGEVLLSTQVISSPVSAVSFSSLINSDFFAYKLRVTSMAPATAADLYLRLSSSAAFNSSAGAYGWSLRNIITSGGSDTGSASDTKIQISRNTVVATAAEGGWSGEIIIYGGYNAGLMTRCTFNGAYRSASNDSELAVGHGKRTAADATDGFQLLFNGQNIAFGIVQLFGLR